jgi:quercetin dioxygenase-like cupin family protein
MADDKGKRLEAWETADRVHVRGLTADYEVLEALTRLRAQPRVIKPTDRAWKGGPRMFNKVIMDPGFQTLQSMYIHIKEFVPGTVSQIHGHQNPAMMYVIRGTGYDVQDGEKLEWAAGDVAVVKGGTVHYHVCTGDEPARVLIMKPKPLYLFLNLMFQRLLVPASKEPMPGWEGYKPEL